jgi:hypothetical protein
MRKEDAVVRSAAVRSFLGWSVMPLVLNASASLAEQVVKVGHAHVSYEGIDKPQAEALARTLDAAWKVYTEEFGFKMPGTVFCIVECGPDQPARLYTDGEDHVYLSLPSKAKLAKPATSGLFNLYGMCHELGHIAMYRTLKDRDWMTSAAAEGWAHYAGSAVVDRVWAAHGESLWPDPYDYREDGLARLHKQLESESPSEIDRGAGQWEKFEKILGRKGFARLFAAWEKAGADPTQPAEALLAATIGVQPDKKGAVEAWWKTASGLFLSPMDKSKVQRKTISPARLSGHPLALTPDDGRPDGKMSIAGGGHARKFEAPGPGEWYIRSVSVFGSRYGYPRPPAENFDVALCDGQMKPIAIWKKPYSTFERGEPTWVKMSVPPTRVPKSFYVALNFRPTATKGVYVSFDSSTKGNSVSSIPGQPGEPFEDGDWMIRIELDQPKEADALEAK